MKMHNKFNKEIFIMFSIIIKSKAPEPDYNSSFWNVFTFKLWTIYDSIKRQLILVVHYEYNGQSQTNGYWQPSDISNK